MAVATGTAMLIGAGISAVGGAMKGRADAKAAAKKGDKDFLRQQALSDQEFEQGKQSSAFDAAQTDYYSQLNRQRKQRGLDQFRQFNTIAPANTNRIAVPTLPDASQYKTPVGG